MTIDLNRLRMFSAVAKHRNFGRAALELGITAATLSEHIRNLESDLGARLFNRTTRSVALTEAGGQLLTNINPSLATIGEELAGFGPETQAPTGTLRINGPRPALDFRVTPLIVGFSRQYPGVRIELVADEGFIDVIGAGFDAGVRYGEALAKDMIAVPLGGPQRFCVVGSPKYFEEHGRPSAARRSRSHRAAPSSRPNRIRSCRPPVTGSGSHSCSLSIATPIWAGTLEAVLEDWCQPFAGPHLYYPERRRMPSPLRAFIDFVKGTRPSPRSCAD